VYETAEPPTVAGGWTYRLDARRACAGGALSNVGNVVTWLRSRLAPVDLDEALARPPGAHGLTALPLLAGDRSPTWNDAARALIAGLGLATSAMDIAQAMGEGVALRAGLVARALLGSLPEIDTIVATGGTGLAHPALLQLCADAIGRPLVASAAGEGTARGAAIVALERIGALAEINAAAAPRGATFRPRRRLARAFADALARQTRLEEAVRDFDAERRV
jgi:gluconokinase